MGSRTANNEHRSDTYGSAGSAMGQSVKKHNALDALEKRVVDRVNTEAQVAKITGSGQIAVSAQYRDP